MCVGGGVSIERVGLKNNRGIAYLSDITTCITYYVLVVQFKNSDHAIAGISAFYVL